MNNVNAFNNLNAFNNINAFTSFCMYITIIFVVIKCVVHIECCLICLFSFQSVHRLYPVFRLVLLTCLKIKTWLPLLRTSSVSTNITALLLLLICIIKHAQKTVIKYLLFVLQHQNKLQKLLLNTENKLSNWDNQILKDFYIYQNLKQTGIIKSL